MYVHIYIYTYLFIYNCHMGDYMRKNYGLNISEGEITLKTEG